MNDEIVDWPPGHQYVVTEYQFVNMLAQRINELKNGFAPCYIRHDNTNNSDLFARIAAAEYYQNALPFILTNVKLPGEKETTKKVRFNGPDYILPEIPKNLYNTYHS